jgi:hypothetical protein
MLMKWDGITPSQYDQLRKTVQWEPNVPPGAVFHVAAFGKNEIHFTDIWESAEEMNAFIHDRLMPGVMKLGIKNQPTVETYPVHAIFVPALQRVSETLVSA